MNFSSISFPNNSTRDSILPLDTHLPSSCSDSTPANHNHSYTGISFDQDTSEDLLAAIASIESSSSSPSSSPPSPSTSLDLQYHLHQLNPQQQHAIYMGDSLNSPRDDFSNLFSTLASHSEGQNHPHQHQHQHQYDILSQAHGNTHAQDQNKDNHYSDMISESAASILSFNRSSSSNDIPLTSLEQSSLSRSINKSKKLSLNNNRTTSTTNNNNNNNNNATPLGKKSKRRKHKNSKLGCATCKERRVKCSEDLPSCTNCIKHKVKCPYLEYTEEQLNELRQAQFLQQQPSDSEDETPQAQLLQNKVTKPKAKRNKLSTSQNRPHSGSASSSSSSSSNMVNDSKQHSITQNFDNLLTQRSEHNLSIVYPVYSYNQKEVSTTPFSQDSNRNNSNESPTLLRAFVGALNIPTTFKYKIKKRIDYSAKLNRTLKVIGPSIHKGTSGLPEIRDLYSCWLNSFIFKAFTSELMFYCLLNLTTNFLISNCLRDSNKFMENAGQLTPNSRGYSLAHIRLECTQHSLRYYALVIRDLKKVLNDHNDPDLCGSVSYILSLMSIYDPEATLNSSICFRDGLFSIFNHNFQPMKKAPGAGEGSAHSIVLLPAHQRLMSNIAMSVFLPGYDPTFLSEYQKLLSRFGELIFPLLQHYKSTSVHLPKPNYDFLQTHYHELLDFTTSLNYFIPQITSNLSDLEKQKELLFQMLFTWVRMFPSRLISSSKSDPPLIKMLHLFFKLMKKSLYAIFPQVKYFFLRDFDSPLMSDVFATDINSIFEELDDPGFRDDNDNNNRLPPELYVPLINELKSMSSYLIRGINYFERRLSKLYRVLVTHSEALQFDDSNIEDVAECRDKFAQLVGLKELHITSFIHQTILYENYPRIIGEEGSHGDSEEADGHMISDKTVDFMTLQPNGLLVNDFDPRNGV
ncbi:hypothetical protein Cantr_10132 [Candida viswanathii]|uniref:Zn(2)-C6 fungal-type domain-containing protein n=1 Tax=Candida viswanathii TaxID=5486 RepID=A0A367YDH5_9ASCO|nr:hypothetical protein Cantr_10132 [Candida viswanathii]